VGLPAGGLGGDPFDGTFLGSGPEGFKGLLSTSLPLEERGVPMEEFVRLVTAGGPVLCLRVTTIDDEELVCVEGVTSEVLE